ncbi:hypothetical protein D8O27_13135 [Burkholderia mallei]|uniref:Uncharacterized protein n=2 Tax=Burkholderia mallei TaxID=13373 RepID=A0AAX1XEG6_BURML|nr:hypothetical protein BMAA0395 [Burkholderia mallei ATCC 23344]RKN97947.1 hypothetical protein D8O31_13555 [Burkholderia mallei]RKO01295.1 hypothetical protein D8O03_13975 [Burkholderia mallei]RKO05049.1 hypothetical protein D8O05_12100 [Burkholderia mallei]RKO11970.1 hypothetical protein D8O04_15860 [Burkholderia mallei]
MLFVFRRLFRRAHSGAQRLVGRVVYLAAQKAGAKQAPRPHAHGRRAAARRVRRQAFARASRAAAANPACSPCQALSGSHSADRIHLNKFTRNYW